MDPMTLSMMLGGMMPGSAGAPAAGAAAGQAAAGQPGGLPQLSPAEQDQAMRDKIGKNLREQATQVEKMGAQGGQQNPAQQQFQAMNRPAVAPTPPPAPVPRPGAGQMNPQQMAPLLAMMGLAPSGPMPGGMPV